MKEIHQHGQCLNSAISNGAQSAPQSELQQKDPASQILEEQPEALRGLFSWLFGLDRFRRKLTAGQPEADPPQFSRLTR
jgi:hypothetical protein